MTEWSEHVKRYAKKHKMSYRKASMDSKCKEAYRKKKKRMSPRRMSPKKTKGSKRMSGGGTSRIKNEDSLRLTDEEKARALETEMSEERLERLREFTRYKSGAIRSAIERGVDPNIEEWDGYTFLCIASLYGHLDTVRYLVEKGADPNKPCDSSTPLSIASYNGHLDIVKYLIEEAGADPNKTVGKLGSPMQNAVQSGHPEIVEYLRSKGGHM